MIGDGFKGKLFSCVAAGLAFGVLTPKMTAREGWNSRIPRQTPPSVLLISLDTVRADHLGCYGYSRIETPNNSTALLATVSALPTPTLRCRSRFPPTSPC
jgi:hypothetical protein